MEGQLERERRGLWMRRAGGQTFPGAALDGAKPRGQPTRGGVFIQGQSSYQTGVSLTDPANLPNYCRPGLQPRSRAGWGGLGGRQGDAFDSSWGRDSKPERTPAKQVMVHGRISDPRGRGSVEGN